jgi:DNA (cytosine-5)-methyltransferase 1
LLEYNKDACRTLRANRNAFGAACEIHEGDVRSFDFSRFSNIDLLAAGAPCQPFSIGGKHRAHDDDRNLFPQVFRAVREARPKAIVIENVKGLLRASLANFVEYVELQLSMPEIVPCDPLNGTGWLEHLEKLRRAKRRKVAGGLTYAVRRLLLNAADFGVPQVRERVFFVAFRQDLNLIWDEPLPSHSRAALRISQEASGSYWQRHGLRRGTHPSHPYLGSWIREAGNRLPWCTVRDALHGLPEPVTNSDGAEWANHVGQPGARSYPGHTGSPLDRPAKTLKAGVHGVPGGENMLRRPNGTVRYFTVREAARLQTFPDDYTFTGAWGEAMRQIGNAVPVQLARAVASSMADALIRGAGGPEQRYQRSRPVAEQVEMPELLTAFA